MIAAPLATAGWLRWPRLSRSYHLNLSSIVRVKECNLKSIGSLILCTFSLLLAETPPVHLLKEFLKKSLQQKGLLVLRALQTAKSRNVPLLTALIAGKLFFRFRVH